MAKFPIEYVKKTDKIACLFSAAFGGEYDVKQLRDAGCNDITLVDIDAKKLAEQGKLMGFHYEITDAFEWICRQEDKSFDVLVCDQWSGQHHDVNVTYIDELKRIARHVVIVGCGLGELNNEGHYFYRSSFKGGTYWRVIRV